MLVAFLARVSAVVLSAAASIAAPQLVAELNVTDSRGVAQEGRRFSHGGDVFLDGALLSPGGAPAVLADGEYVFQVTDASGAWLLSRDRIAQRRVVVHDGVVMRALGLAHATRDLGPGRGIAVGLAPFDSTMAPGGELRVWLTRVEDFDVNATQFFGFRPSASLATSFVVNSNPLAPQTSIIKGYTFFDHNEDGVWNPLVDPLEVPVAGWRVELWLNGMLDGVTFTDQNGRYEFIRNRDGTLYTVREIAPGGFVGDGIVGAEWVAHTPREAPVVASVELPASPTFGVVSLVVQPHVGRPSSWWRASDGRFLLQLCDPLWRDSLRTFNGGPLSLRRSVSSDVPSISIYKPALAPEPFNSVYNGYSNYLGSPSNDHAGFLLSIEVATAILNNDCGFMQFPAYIDRFQDGILVPFEEMLEGAIGLLNEVGAGLTGPNDPFQDLRLRMQMCTNEFGSINNTAAPNAPQIVYARSTIPNVFLTPY